ncbi:MAG: RNA polymerase sigma factor [Myxococcales bacterium]|nr:RNA polymerase sigma factor [Myxococcales bacterium]
MAPLVIVRLALGLQRGRAEVLTMLDTMRSSTTHAQPGNDCSSPVPAGPRGHGPSTATLAAPKLSEVRRGLPALRPLLFARALKLSRSRARAEDLVQETMLRALRFEAQFHADTNLRAWLGQVLMRVFLSDCRNHSRERRRNERVLFESPVHIATEVREPMRSLPNSLARALASLPVGHRRAIELVDLEEHGYRAAAEHLGVPIGTVMSRLHRGRKLLALRLSEQLVPQS